MANVLGTTQTGILAITPTDANGTPLQFSDVPTLTAASSDETVATVTPHVGSPGEFVVSPFKEGSVTITVTGTTTIGTTVTTAIVIQIVAVATGLNYAFSAH